MVGEHLERYNVDYFMSITIVTDKFTTQTQDHRYVECSFSDEF